VGFGDIARESKGGGGASEKEAGRIGAKEGVPFSSVDSLTSNNKIRSGPYHQAMSR